MRSSRPMRCARFWLVLAVLSGIDAAHAHQFAPSLLDLHETGPDRAAVSWKQPIARVQGSRLQPMLPAQCKGIGDPNVERAGTGMIATWEIACPDGLVGKTVGVDGIPESRADVLLRVELADGRSFRQVLTAEVPSFEITTDVDRFGVLGAYIGLGVEHILTGWDHLLFVLGLVLLVGLGRSLLWTITAFTLGHSLTLALASLGFVRFPQGLIEAGIALSIYLLAVEILRDRMGYKTLMKRAPWVVAACFGLLHGLGFAGALAEVGFPPGDIPLALLSFNIGIELGQLAFIAVVILVMAALRLVPARWPPWVEAVPAYGIGSVAVFWVFERLTGLPGS